MRKRYGTAARGAVSFFLLAAVFGCGLFTEPCSAAGKCRVEEILSAAHDRKLHQDRYWQILMHYEKRRSGFVSQVDDPEFFLSPDGKRNPAAELDATMRHLFGGAEVPQEALCRFYARYGWLEEKLSVQFPSCFANRSCPEIDRIEPQSASLVFPTYYLNNPASMFGHTLLTVDTAYTSRRLSNAVNYAAFTEGGDGLSLAISGLTGLYRGYYSVLPYYKKIREYSDINQRDIWEYRLNLTSPELRRMVRHIREMDQIYSDYYFFDENCSYNLLYLLEAARPSTRLVDRFRIAAIPVDTIKAVKSEGMVENADYRPAPTTRIDHLGKGLDKEEIDTVKRIAEGASVEASFTGRSFPRHAKIRILDLAAEVIQYRYVTEDIDQQTYRDRLLAALSSRSRLGRSDEAGAVEIPSPPRPENGHDSQRLSGGFGLFNAEGFYELRFRAALTDLTDMDYVHRQGAQIEFCDLRTRYYSKQERLYVQQAELIDIVSLAPMSDFYHPLSWKANTGWHRKPLRKDENGFYYRLNGGAGFTGRYAESALAYLLLETEMDTGSVFDSDYAAGGGLSAGTVFSPADALKIHLFSRAVRFFMGDEHSEYTAGGVANFRIRTNHHLSLEACWEDAGLGRYTGSAAWHWFF